MVWYMWYTFVYLCPFLFTHLVLPFLIPRTPFMHGDIWDSSVQRPPSDVFSILHALEMYALDALVCFGDCVFECGGCGCRCDDAAA